MAESSKQDSFPVRALVVPGARYNGKYDYEIDGWRISSFPWGLGCASAFPIEFNHKAALEHVRVLDRLLLALFVLDFLPRRLHCFEYSLQLLDHRNNSHISYSQLFGKPRGHGDSDERLSEVGSSQGTWWLFHGSLNEPLDWSPSLEAVKEWYGTLTSNPRMIPGLSLIKEAFWKTNKLFGSYRYDDSFEFVQAVLLLISGLENVFFNGFDDHAEISFKFGVVGTALYTRFAKQSFLDIPGRPSRGLQKLSPTTFQEVLKRLYAFRSAVAHGSVGGILEGKNVREWNKLIQLLSGSKVETGSSDHLRGQILIALGELQRHILAIYVGAREQILDGRRILDDLLSSNH